MRKKIDSQKENNSNSVYKKNNQRSIVQDPILIFAKRYQAFFDSTTDGIAIFNSKGEILDANPRFIKLTETTYENIVSKNITDIITNDLKKFQKHFRAVLNGQKMEHPIEYVLQSISGKRKPVEVNLSLLVDQYGYSKTVMAVVRDVAKRKEAESRLIQRVEELQKVFDAVPNILLLFDDKRRIRRINRSGILDSQVKASSILGKRIGEVLGCIGHFDSARGCDLGSMCKKCMLRESVLRCVKNGETIRDYEESIYRVHYKETPFYYRINVIPLNTDGKIWGVMSLENITQRKKAEQEASQLQDSIAQANLELKKTLEDLARSQSQLIESQKLEQIGLLASGLTHNMKTPISGIKGYAQLLKMDYPDSSELDMIVDEVEVLESIINDIMLKSRKDHENKEEMLNLNHLLRIELNFLQSNLFYKHMVEKEISLDENLPELSGVYGHFSQAIMNIIQNALDAMYHTKIRKLTIKTRHDDKYIYIDIGDTGTGISDEIKDSIFDTFFTTKPSSVERQGDEPFGTGLGLSNALYFVRQYGGHITIDSVVGKGSVFSIQVPYAQGKNRRGIHRILIIDDSQSMVDILVQISQDMGIQVYGATDGAKGLELYSRLKPDVIVTDLLLPELTGLEMINEIRKMNPDQKVIYISGYSENPKFREWLNQEIRNPSLCALLKKPFPMEEFKRVLHRMVYQ